MSNTKNIASQVHSDVQEEFIQKITNIEIKNNLVEEKKGLSLIKLYNYFRNIPYFAIYAMCIGVIWVGWSWPAVVVAFLLYFFRMFAITGFYHRYFSHKSFKTTRVFQFIMAFCGMMSVQRGPLWWAAHHRHHHAFSDKPKDEHSPHQHKFIWAHMLWFTTPKNFNVNKKLVPDLLKFKELAIMEHLDILPPILLGLFTFFLGFFLDKIFPEMGTSGMQMLIWGFFVSTMLLYNGTFSINSLAHLMGKKRYNTGDESRNSLILALITLGEGWHNNHHYYKGSARQGFFWWEIDITYYGLVVLSWFRIISDLQPVPARVKNSNKI